MNEELRRAVIEDAIKNYGKSGAGMRWSDESIKLYMQLPEGEHTSKKHMTHILYSDTCHATEYGCTCLWKSRTRDS